MIEIQDPVISYREFPGPILLLAGPGTGKTFQLGQRVKYLMEERGASRDEICVITFTNEAARNMREHLQEPHIGLEPEQHPSIISTMHSLGNAIIGCAPDRVGLPDEYRVLANPHIRKVVLQDASYLTLGDREQWGLTDACRRSGDCANCRKDIVEDKCRVCAKYVEIIRKCSHIDYDDQIMLACQMMENHADLATDWRAKTKYLLVDEYQDINHAQFRMIQLLTHDQTDGLFAVGDDDQSIYSFRGGSPAYIQHFDQHFGDEARIGRLAMSWRCPEHILKAGRSIIATYYPGSVPKPEPTFSEKIKENNKVVFLDVPSEQWEASIIAAEVQPHLKDSRIVVIVPNSNYFPPIRDALRRKGIPYRYKASASEEGLVRFATLADWADNPADSLSLRHVLELIIQNHNDFMNSIEDLAGPLGERRIAASNRVAALWDVCTPVTPLLDAVHRAATDSGEGNLLAEMKTQCIDTVISLLKDHGTRRAYLPRFLESCGLFVAPGRNAVALVNEVREWRDEIFEGATGSPVRPVEIYNLPSSKGLEGHLVFVVGVTEDLLPNPKKDIEEESRLLYVAMTRAKRTLYLLSSRKRSAGITFKQQSYQLSPSPFADAIPADHIDVKRIYPKKKRGKK